MQRMRSLEDIAVMLEATRRFKVLRLMPEKFVPVAEGTVPGDTFVGVTLSTASSGGNPRADRFDLAMIKFVYDPTTGGVLRRLDDLAVGAVECGGMDDDAVDAPNTVTGDVERFMEGVNLVLAFDARSERPVVERIWPHAFASRAWACLGEGVDWAAEAIDPRRLQDVVTGLGFYRDRGVGALSDAAALLHVIASPLPVSARMTLGALLDGARRASILIVVRDVADDACDRLAVRGYSRHPAQDGVPEMWTAEAEGVEGEIEWLRSELFDRGDGVPGWVRLTARNRFKPLSALARDGAVAGWAIDVEDKA